MTAQHLDRSYRALFAVPTLGRIMIGMGIARVAQSMVSVALVLFTLREYNDPGLAGLVTFASTFPGIVVSPIAGVLLDRHGRIRLIILDYLVALGSLVLIAALALSGMLPSYLLVVIATLASLTTILSAVGLRTLFPLIVPKHLWERANAIDSNGYVVATILGPPIAASLVAVFGGAVALLGVGLAFGLAAVSMIGIRDPATEVTATGRLLDDAIQGLHYFWNNRTLRGLGFSIAVLNLSGGMATIVVPLLVLSQLGQNVAIVGLVFAVSGLAGMVSALFFGRMDSRGREWPMLVLPPLGFGAAIALVLPVAMAAPAGSAGAIEPVVGIALIFASQFLIGILNGPLDIALFTVRQRRTDPAWMGRAFAVSMGVNFAGFPIGAALTGGIATWSLPAAVTLGIAASLGSSVFAATMVPREGPA